MTRSGCYGRGILAFERFEPARRPGEKSSSSKAATTGANASRESNAQAVPVPPVRDGKRPIKLIARCSYKANVNRPGGFDELSLIQGEIVEFIEPHPINPFWWLARNSEEQKGYVPATYLKVLEQKISSLPWLDQKREAEKKEEEEREKNINSGPFGPTPPGTWKPYRSAYNHSIGETKLQAKQWYCEVCDKQLNGPKPYQAHIVSRAHKDELEAQGLS